MKRLLALIFMLPFIMASGNGDCGGSSGGCSGGTTAPCPETQLSGEWNYQRDVNGGYKNSANGGQTVFWMFRFRDGIVKWSGGYLAEWDDFGIKHVWNYTGPSIERPYQENGNSVTFEFDDGMEPARAVFTGTIVSQYRIEGDGWVANWRQGGL